MSNPEPTFEEAIEELEAITAALEQGSDTLEAGLARFERGVALLRRCREILGSVEAKIRELVDIDENGVARWKDFAHEASHDAGQSKEPRAPRKRSAKTKAPEPLDPPPADPSPDALSGDGLF